MAQQGKYLCDILLVLLAIAVTIWGALHYGWLNDDAQNYLTLAGHVYEGKNLSLRPSWGDPYWAVFPAGYPVVIAAFKLLTGDVFSASKIANGVLLAGAIGFYASWLRVPLLAAASVFLSVWGLEIASYSWSENLFFFAHALALSSLGLYLDSGKKRFLAAYGAGLIFAVFSRYIGGFLLAGYMLALAICWFSVPRARLMLAAGVTCLTGAAFALYLYVNLRLTGAPTGMTRDPAPETIFFLTGQFLFELLCSLWVLLPPLFLLWLGRTKNLLPAFALSTPVRLLFAVGGSYLAILFVLRCSSRFEQFSGRMLSPGILILGMGLLAYFNSAWQARQRHRVRLVFALLFAFNLGLLYVDFIRHPALITTQSAAGGFANYDKKYGGLPDGTVLISAGYLDPMVSWHFLSPILGSDRVFYALMDNYPLTYSQYRRYIARLRYKEKPPPVYLFDFSELPTIQSFDAMIKNKQMDPALTEWMRRHFSPLKFVRCTDCQSFETDDHDHANH